MGDDCLIDSVSNDKYNTVVDSIIKECHASGAEAAYMRHLAKELAARYVIVDQPPYNPDPEAIKALRFLKEDLEGLRPSDPVDAATAQVQLEKINKMLHIWKNDARYHTQMYDKAVAIALKAHAGQNYAGDPYIIHPMSIANKFVDMNHQIVAILHDVIEDSGITIEDLITKGIPKRLATCVQELSRSKTETYDMYMERLIASGIKLVLEVKLADMQYNYDHCSDNDATRKAKYEKWLPKIAEAVSKL
jgi:hypothetical protein